LIHVAAWVNDYVTLRRKKGTSHKSINNELEVLIKTLRVAYENNKLFRIPIIHKLTINNVRQGFFEENDFIRVRHLLREDYQVAVTIAKVYGWRMQSEFLSLEWRHVDLHPTVGTLRLDPGTTKDNDGRIVYLTSELNTMLTAQLQRVQALERQMGKIIPYVFPHRSGKFQGDRIQDFKKAWETACKKAGCPGMLRHDFRRTAVRNFERAAVPRSIAMKNTGHRTESVYSRYDIVNDADLKLGRDRLEDHSRIIDRSHQS
jgi:integrase